MKCFFKPTTTLLLTLLLSKLRGVLGEKSDQDVTPEVCFDGFTALEFQFDAFDRYDSFWRNESFMINPAAGTYTGRDEIEEYFRFLSPTNPAVEVADGDHRSSLKGIVNGTCKILLFTNSWYQFMPTTTRGSSYNVTFMSMINYNPTDNYIESLILYLPELWTDDLFGVTYGSDRSRRWICETMEERCPEVWTANQDVLSEVPVVVTARNSESDFAMQACIEKLRGMPYVTDDHRVDGNSQGCRALNAQLASLNDQHCPHLSFVPQEDSEVNVKCQQSDLIQSRDFFDDEDIAAYNGFLERNSWRVNVPEGFKVTDLEEMNETEINGIGTTNSTDSAAFGAQRMGYLGLLASVLVALLV